jgi:hypothetical protein
MHTQQGGVRVFILLLLLPFKELLLLQTNTSETKVFILIKEVLKGEVACTGTTD